MPLMRIFRRFIVYVKRGLISGITKSMDIYFLRIDYVSPYVHSRRQTSRSAIMR